MLSSFNNEKASDQSTLNRPVAVWLLKVGNIELIENAWVRINLNSAHVYAHDTTAEFKKNECLPYIGKLDFVQPFESQAYRITLLGHKSGDTKKVLNFKKMEWEALTAGHTEHGHGQKG